LREYDILIRLTPFQEAITKPPPLGVVAYFKTLQSKICAS